MDNDKIKVIEMKKGEDLYDLFDYIEEHEFEFLDYKFVEDIRIVLSNEEYD